MNLPPQTESSVPLVPPIPPQPGELRRTTYVASPLDVAVLIDWYEEND